MHPALRKGPLFTKHPPFSTLFDKKTPPPHFISCLRAWPACRRCPLIGWKLVGGVVWRWLTAGWVVGWLHSARVVPADICVDHPGGRRRRRRRADGRARRHGGDTRLSARALQPTARRHLLPAQRHATQRHTSVSISEQGRNKGSV